MNHRKCVWDFPSPWLAITSRRVNRSVNSISGHSRLGQKEGIQLVFTFDCVPRHTYNFAAFHLIYSRPGDWTLPIFSKFVRVKFCHRNAQSTKPLVPTSVINDTWLRLPKQFIRENESPQKFRARVRTEHIQGMINEFPDDTVPSENVITSLDAVETIFSCFHCSIQISLLYGCASDKSYVTFHDLQRKWFKKWNYPLLWCWYHISPWKIKTKPSWEGDWIRH